MSCFRITMHMWCTARLRDDSQREATQRSVEIQCFSWARLCVACCEPHYTQQSLVVEEVNSAHGAKSAILTCLVSATVLYVTVVFCHQRAGVKIAPSSGSLVVE